MNITLLAGTENPPETLQLASQQVPIRSVTIDNANSDTDVLVYGGTSPSGPVQRVKAGWSRCFPNSTSAVYIVLAGTPQVDGAIFVSVSDEAQTAFSTQVVTLGGSVIANINSAFPQNAVPFSESVQGTVGSVTGTPLSIIMLPLSSKQSVYLTTLVTCGFIYQPSIVWELLFGVIGTFSVPVFGMGDINASFNPPQVIPYITSGNTLYLGYAPSATPTGVLNVIVTVGGYYL